MILYYQTLSTLGTDKHRPIIDRLIDQKELGCFALTELGHGSNVKGLMTTATYDHESKTFDLHTPNEQAVKFWIGNSLTANAAAVWA